MPITPLHFGPGIAMKALLAGTFSWSVFVLTNCVIDIETVANVLRGADRLHAYAHTYVGATLVAIPCALAGRPLCEWVLRLWNQRLDARQKIWLSVDPSITPLAAWSGALLAAWSHVALDSLMHPDMEPLWPFATGNALLGAISLDALHLLCLGTAAAGIAVLALLRVIR
jgi:hypothetical protein